MEEGFQIDLKPRTDYAELIDFTAPIGNQTISELIPIDPKYDLMFFALSFFDNHTYKCIDVDINRLPNDESLGFRLPPPNYFW